MDFSGFWRFISIYFFVISYSIMPSFWLIDMNWMLDWRCRSWFDSKLFKWYQNSRSIGAIAGFAVAIVFTWRLFRSPTGSQRRQPKRQAPAPSSSGVDSPSNSTLTTTGVSSLEDTRAQNVVDEFFQPVKVTVICLPHGFYSTFYWHGFCWIIFLWFPANLGADS